MSNPRFFSYSPKTTSISFPWPAEVTGLERIALSAQGDLQRVLSAFFARPISIALVYSHTYTHPTPDHPGIPLTLPNPSAIQSVSEETPITQTRQVHLQCSGKIVCTATSTVRMTSPKVAHLFLEEKYAIGQMFTRLEKVPAFELFCVDLGALSGETKAEHPDQLWRKYKLFIPEFECEILEVFPSRQMFVGGGNWLDDKEWDLQEFGLGQSTLQPVIRRHRMTSERVLILLLATCLLMILGYEVSRYTNARLYPCPM